MDYQSDDIAIANIDAQTVFNLMDFNNRFTSIQNYINGTRTKVNNLSSNKVDKVTGKGLSTNDFVSANYYTKSDLYTKTEVNTELAKKVDKVTNYGLSKNDFTDSYKTTLDNLYSTSNTSKNGHTHLYAGSSTAGGVASGSEKIKTTQTSSNTNFQIPFVNNVTSEQKTLYTDNTNGHLSYNPSTNTLKTTYFSGIATYASNIGNASVSLSYTMINEALKQVQVTGKVTFTITNSSYTSSYTGIGTLMEKSDNVYTLRGYTLVGTPTIEESGNPGNGSHYLTITVTSNSPFTFSVTRTGQGWLDSSRVPSIAFTVKRS